MLLFLSPYSSAGLLPLVHLPDHRSAIAPAVHPPQCGYCQRPPRSRFTTHHTRPETIVHSTQPSFSALILVQERTPTPERRLLPYRGVLGATLWRLRDRLFGRSREWGYRFVFDQMRTTCHLNGLQRLDYKRLNFIASFFPNRNIGLTNHNVTPFGPVV